MKSLTAAKAHYSLTDRTLGVLSALLSCHPEREIGPDTLVFPSNRFLAERAHGMAESTLRRHLAALVNAGLIVRHDSPNGKRYARRDRSGQITRAFGFDLSPLLYRAQEFAEAAETARSEVVARTHLKEAVTLLLRDALQLARYGQSTGQQGPWCEVEDKALLAQQQLRRKLDINALETLRDAAQTLVQQLTERLSQTEEMSGTVVENERHIEESKKEYYEDKPNKEIPLNMALNACHDLNAYATEKIRSWSDFIRLAAFAKNMLAITPSTWNTAIERMGAVQASIAVGYILQKAQVIKCPGSYLRKLSETAESGSFNAHGMLVSLLNASEKLTAVNSTA